MAMLRHVVGIALLLSAARGQYQLIWEDNFDFLDLEKWTHEVSAWGGWVSIKSPVKTKLIVI